MRALRLLAAAALAGALGCANPPTSEDVATGPPPDVAVDGARYDHQGIDLVYDAARGAYRVGRLRDHWYHRGTYYRLWQGRFRSVRRAMVKESAR